MIKTSLIVSTYNWPQALELCLKSILAQVVLPAEVIVADDGSEPATKVLIEQYKNEFSIPIIHVWHEDEGFQLAKIRNKAIAAAAGDYIIQIDGDIILHKRFISDHLRFAKPGSFVRASRIYMDETLSRTLLSAKSTDVSLLKKGISNKLSALHLPSVWRFFEYNYKATGEERFEIHGCNMAYWRNDAIAVNGYNEEFKGWGPEDKEFIVRLLNNGITKRFIKMGALVFHIYHPETLRNNLLKNESILKDAIKTNKKICEIGLNQYRY